jgi:hypothetical protein
MAELVSLSEMKQYLRYPNPDIDSPDDFLIGEFMDSASDVVRRECGDVVQTSYDEWYRGGDCVIVLRHVPVLSITSVIENWGFTNYVLTAQPGDSLPQNTTLWAYSLDQPDQGVITRRSVGNVMIPFVWPTRGDNIRIQYVAGRSTVPGAIRHAYMDLVAYWWQSAMQRSYSAGGSMPNSGFSGMVQDGGMTGFNAGVPYRILEILRGERRTPIIG